MHAKRHLTKLLLASLERGKSILLLGPRQTGKTTLITEQITCDIMINLMSESTRIRYEKDPALLEKEILGYKQTHPKAKNIIVFIDEIQKIPSLLNTAQVLIDQHIAQFIFTGSSARKLRKNSEINLLPGRVTALRLDPLMISEIDKSISLDNLLLYGTLPPILNTYKKTDKEEELQSYVTTYLQEEIRAEAIVKQLGTFARFLELAASKSGQIINSSKLSQEIGIAQTTIASYFQILEDCLIIHRIDAYTKNSLRKKLTKSPKYIFFDLGIRRACAVEGITPTSTTKGLLFEQFVGLELIKELRFLTQKWALKFWRDPNGPEVDFVLEGADRLIPIEVKLTDNPNATDIRHLTTFLKEYPQATQGYVICQCPAPLLLAPNILAVNWKDLAKLKFLENSL